MGAPGSKRQLLTPALFRFGNDPDIRYRLRTENLDAEDLAVNQVQLAGIEERPIYTVKIAVYDGGELVWPNGIGAAEIERLVMDTTSGYEIADATPFYLDFPLPPHPRDFNRYERFFAVLLLGPRLSFVERGPGGRYAVKPIEASGADGAEKPPEGAQD